MNSSCVILPDEASQRTRNELELFRKVLEVLVKNKALFGLHSRVNLGGVEMELSEKDERRKKRGVVLYKVERG